MGDLEQFRIDLKNTAKSLRAAGDADLARQLSKRIGEAARPLLDEIRSTLPEYMPDRYAKVLGQDLRLSTSKRLTGRAGASVTIRAGVKGSKQRKLRRLDRGTLAHPFFGRRRKWFNQDIKKGFFTNPIRHEEPELREAIRKAMDDVADEAARRH